MFISFESSYQSYGNEIILMYAVSEQGKRDRASSSYLIFRSGDTHEEKQVSQGNADTQVYQDQILVILNIPVNKND